MNALITSSRSFSSDHRPLDVRFDVPRRVVDLVSCLGHARRILSPRYRAPDTRRHCDAQTACSSWSSLILAGCGGSGAPASRRSACAGPGSRFTAPGGWKVVQRSGGKVAATPGLRARPGGDLPAAEALPRRALRSRVASELTTRMGAAWRSRRGGTVSAPRTVTAGGVRSHSYTVHGRRPRRRVHVRPARHAASFSCSAGARRRSGDDACRQLLTSFATT